VGFLSTVTVPDSFHNSCYIPLPFRFFANVLKYNVGDLPPQNIYNMDETCMAWNSGRQKVLVKKGQKYANILRSASKSSATVAFTITAAGEMLPTFIVHKVSWLSCCYCCLLYGTLMEPDDCFLG
jgi:hypothetical protein